MFRLEGLKECNASRKVYGDRMANSAAPDQNRSMRNLICIYLLIYSSAAKSRENNKGIGQFIQDHGTLFARKNCISFFKFLTNKSSTMLLSMSHDSLSNVLQQSHNDYARKFFNLQTIQQLFYHLMSGEFDLTDMLRTAACLLTTFATEA